MEKQIVGGDDNGFPNININFVDGKGNRVSKAEHKNNKWVIANIDRDGENHG